jgi:polyhydroxyalkanoate synthase
MADRCGGASVSTAESGSGDGEVDAVDSVQGGELVGIPTVGAVVGSLASAFRSGASLSRETVRLGAELIRVAAGRSQLAPARGDRRFSDSAWTTNPGYRRVEQAYLAWAGAVNQIVDDYASTAPDFRRAERATFAANIMTSICAPTNFFATNPAAVKRAFDTGGVSLLRGTRNFMSDLRHNGGMPSQVDRSKFELGQNLAASPGAVIDRDPLAEVLQFRPTIATACRRPVLVVPPPIGRYYFLDLAPGRSFVEFAANRGLETFVLSWRNPTDEQSEWDLDSYAGRVLSAIDAVREVTGSDNVDLMGFCAGGIIATTLLNYLAASGDHRVHSMSYAVTLLDFGERAPIAAFQGHALLEFAKRRSRRKGIITSRDMGAAFTWMRPDDLVFNYWVNNYLMGEKPPAFDILAWNADGTNLPANLHGQFLDIFRRNLLVQPGAISVLGAPVHLDRIKVPTFVVGAITDHLTPWKGCYRTTKLLGGETTFVLTWSGHIASLVNPPDNPRAHYWTGEAPGPDPDAWFATAAKHQGSWWEVWADWVVGHDGEQHPTRDSLGSIEHPILDPAPGRYVRDLPPTDQAMREGPDRAPSQLGS